MDPRHDPNPLTSYADRFRRHLDARSEEELHQPRPGASFAATVGSFILPVLGLWIGTLALCALLGAVLMVEEKSDGATDLALVWAITAVTGGLAVGTGLLKPVARFVRDHRPNPGGLFVVWVGAAVGWALLAALLGWSLQASGAMPSATPSAEGAGEVAEFGVLGQFWVLLAGTLLSTLVPWLLTRTWRWPRWVVVLVAVVGMGLVVAMMGAAVITLGGNWGWWSTPTVVSPVVTMPGLLWLAHRPMGHLSVSARPEFDGPLGF